MTPFGIEALDMAIYVFKVSLWLALFWLVIIVLVGIVKYCIES